MQTKSTPPLPPPPPPRAPSTNGTSQSSPDYLAQQPLRRQSIGSRSVSRRVEPGFKFDGPGPSSDIKYDKVHKCFDQGNGYLFRLEDTRRHIWYFYNDTCVYIMHVSITFGNESMINPLGNAKQEVLNEETGNCRVELDVGPGETQPFMRGEYNGLLSYYDAVPIPFEERREEWGNYS